MYKHLFIFDAKVEEWTLSHEGHYIERWTREMSHGITTISFYKKILYSINPLELS